MKGRKLWIISTFLIIWLFLILVTLYPVIVHMYKEEKRNSKSFEERQQALTDYSTHNPPTDDSIYKNVEKYLQQIKK